MYSFIFYIVTLKLMSLYFSPGKFRDSFSLVKQKFKCWIAQTLAEPYQPSGYSLWPWLGLGLKEVKVTGISVWLGQTHTHTGTKSKGICWMVKITGKWQGQDDRSQLLCPKSHLPALCFLPHPSSPFQTDRMPVSRAHVFRALGEILTPMCFCFH